MKNISTTLNLILLGLVIILFILFFSLKKSISGGNSMGTANMPGSGLKIAYVNADSINANYLLMRDFKNEIQARQGELQDEYDSKAKNLQDEYQDYEEKAQKGNISQVDAQKTQQDMQQKNDELGELKQKQQELMSDAQEKNIELQGKIQQYIAQYNKKAGYDYILGYDNVGGAVLFANQSFDITRSVVDGLNKLYKDSVQKAERH